MMPFFFRQVDHYFFTAELVAGVAWQAHWDSLRDILDPELGLAEANLRFRNRRLSRHGRLQQIVAFFKVHFVATRQSNKVRIVPQNLGE